MSYKITSNFGNIYDRQIIYAKNTNISSVISFNVRTFPFEWNSSSKDFIIEFIIFCRADFVTGWYRVWSYGAIRMCHVPTLWWKQVRVQNSIRIEFIFMYRAFEGEKIEELSVCHSLDCINCGASNLWKKEIEFGDEWILYIDFINLPCWMFIYYK